MSQLGGYSIAPPLRDGIVKKCSSAEFLHQLRNEDVGVIEDVFHTYPVNTTVWVSLTAVFWSTPRAAGRAPP